MAGAAVEVEGLKEFRKALRVVDGDFAKELTKIQRELAKWLAPQAQAAAAAEGGVTRHFAGKISGKGNATGARLEVQSVANAAIWGAKKTTGWNAGQGRTPNQPRWVGSSFEVGGAGGPYGINAAIRVHLTEIDQRYLQGIDELARRAFPT